MIYIFNPLTLLLVYILYTKSSGIYKKIITIIGAIIDFVVNVTWFSIIFLDVPKEWLLTERVERLKQSSGYRQRLASLLCKLLNYFEAGHCI
jgi:hypothetical protein